MELQRATERLLTNSRFLTFSLLRSRDLARVSDGLDIHGQKRYLINRDRKKEKKERGRKKERKKEKRKRERERKKEEKKEKERESNSSVRFNRSSCSLA